MDIENNPHRWHAPGLGEVHSLHHFQMIYCESEKNSEEGPIADDDLAKRVAAALNAQANLDYIEAYIQGRTDWAHRKALLADIRVMKGEK